MITAVYSMLLKDGRTAVVRSPAMSDADIIIGFLRRVYRESDNMIRTEEETRNYSAVAGKRLIHSISTAPDDCVLLCTVDGELAGAALVTYGKPGKIKHRGTVSIAVGKAYWGLGIGTELLKKQISLAESRGDKMQLELDYIEGNDRAAALYKKCGFVETGRKPRAVRMSDGSFRDEISMVCYLK